MESSEKSDISEILEKVGSIHPNDYPLLIKCLSEWLKIQKNRIQVLTLQRRYNNDLITYMKRRQGQLRLVEDFNGPKMMCLLEHIRSPNQFLKLFRIKLPTFFKIKEILYSEDSSSGWIPEIELLLFLFWLSGGLSYKKVEKLLDISEATLCDMFQGVFKRFLKHVCQVIHFPKEKYDYLCKGFSKLTGSHIFGLTVGCLDAFHVLIAFPSQKDDLQYLNDKNEFSVQVQVVCDYRGALMDIAVGFPGSMLKPHVLQCTPLYLSRLLPPQGFVLLSGHGYPCLQEPVCIIPPFTETNTLEKQTFNKYHEKAYFVTRKSVGQMFDRWRRIFSKPIMFPLAEITNIIIACAMIHNICLEMDDVWPKQTSVNFCINEEHLSLLDGQSSGDATQKAMAMHTVFRELPFSEDFKDDRYIKENVFSDDEISMC